MDELFLTRYAGKRRHRPHTVIHGTLSPVCQHLSPERHTAAGLPVILPALPCEPPHGPPLAP